MCFIRRIIPEDGLRAEIHSMNPTESVKCVTSSICRKRRDFPSCSLADRHGGTKNVRGTKRRRCKKKEAETKRGKKVKQNYDDRMTYVCTATNSCSKPSIAYLSGSSKVECGPNDVPLFSHTGSPQKQGRLWLAYSLIRIANVIC